jgi:hypothetical protein
MTHLCGVKKNVIIFNRTNIIVACRSMRERVGAVYNRLENNALIFVTND